MKKHTPTLVVIIILLAIFLPISVFATILHYKNPSEVKDTNVKHEFKYDNKLYYYGDNDELYGTYECKTDECGAIKTIIDDDKYAIDYYKDGELKELNYYDKDFAFLQDDKINIYNYSLERVIATFDSFKNYNTKLKDDIVIAKKDDKWGVLSLKGKEVKIPYEYDFLGLINNIEDDELITTNFVGLKDNNWYIVSIDNNIKSAGLSSEIKTFTDKYIIVKDNTIYDYQGNVITPNVSFKSVYALNNYIIGITDNNTVMVYQDLSDNFLGYANIGDYFKLSFKLDNNKIIIYDNNEEKQSIELN